MGTFVDYFSEVAGAIPTAANLKPNQLAVNIADRTIYMLMPDGTVGPVSQANASAVTPVANDFALHIPLALSDVCQFGCGYTQAQLTAAMTVNASGFATNQYIPVFALGRLLYVPPMSCGVSPVGAYNMTITLGSTNTVVATPLAALPTVSGSIQVPVGVTLTVFSDGQTYPWFYLPNGINSSTADPSTTSLYRVSPFKTFGAIPVSIGPAAQAASSYWGAV